MQRETCETCQGQGRVTDSATWSVDSGTKWARHYEQGVSIECPACNGSGEIVRIQLCNVQTIGARCGYGEGGTKEDAIADAIKLAQRHDPNAYFDGGVVCFSGGINC